jgi:hypothetical protein
MPVERRGRTVDHADVQCLIGGVVVGTDAHAHDPTSKSSVEPGASTCSALSVASVVPDGTFAIEDGPSFVALPPPTTEGIETLLLRVISRVQRCVARGSSANDDIPLDTLDEMRAASAAERSAGAFAGRTGRYEVFFEGFLRGSAVRSANALASEGAARLRPAAASLHCGLRLHENDREGIHGRRCAARCAPRARRALWRHTARFEAA